MSRYTVISKVNEKKFVKLHTNSVANLYDYLIRTYSDFRFMNVFDTSTRKLLGNFTKSKKPEKFD